MRLVKNSGGHSIAVYNPEIQKGARQARLASPDPRQPRKPRLPGRLLRRFRNGHRSSRPSSTRSRLDRPAGAARNSPHVAQRNPLRFDGKPIMPGIPRKRTAHASNPNMIRRKFDETEQDDTSMNIIFATNNAHKFSEVQAVLGPGFRTRSHPVRLRHHRGDPRTTGHHRGKRFAESPLRS